MSEQPVQLEESSPRGTLTWDRAMRWGLVAVIALLVTRFSPASAGATWWQAPALIVGVAEWRQVGGPAQDIQAGAVQRLRQEVQLQGLDEVRIVPLPVTLASAREVDTVASRFGVDVIVWGWYDEVAVRGYVDLADATAEDGKTNCLAVFLERGESPVVIRVLDALSNFDYIQDGVSFCVPRWTP